MLRVCLNVTADPFPFAFVANDVFVEISLPDRDAGRVAFLVDVFGRHSFECPNQLPKGFDFEFTCGRGGSLHLGVSASANL